MKWDPTEVARLDADAQALMRELVGPPDATELLTERLRAQLDNDAEREQEVADRMQRREVYWRGIAGLLNLFADGLDRQDMATIKNAHAGIRALTLRTFLEDHRGQGGVQGES